MANASRKSFQPRQKGARPDGVAPGNAPATPTDQTPDQPIQETAPMTRPAHRNRNAEVDFPGENHSNATHASVTDPDARLFWRAPGAGDAVLHGAYMDG